jgi:hypothetical protein
MSYSPLPSSSPVGPSPANANPGIFSYQSPETDSTLYTPVLTRNGQIISVKAAGKQPARELPAPPVYGQTSYPAFTNELDPNDKNPQFVSRYLHIMRYPESAQYPENALQQVESVMKVSCLPSLLLVLFLHVFLPSTLPYPSCLPSFIMSSFLHHVFLPSFNINIAFPHQVFIEQFFHHALPWPFLCSFCPPAYCNHLHHDLS